MKKVCFAFLGLFLLALAVLWSGCGKSTKPKEEAQTKVGQANAALEAQLYLLIQSDFSGVDRPSDIDFSLANALYKEALAKDPENLDANFGAGLTEFLTISLDAQINATFDRWRDFVQNDSFFVPKAAVLPGREFPKSILNRGFPTDKAAFDLPANFILGSIYSVVYTGLANPPQANEIQNLIDTKLLPRIDYALARLRKVAANLSYRFTITPKMQGDENEDPLELDLTEIYLVITSLELLRSFSNIATAYNFDFPSYDSIGLAQVTAQSSDFLKLRTVGPARLASAKSSFLAATFDLESAINFLKGETDNQDDDIVKIDRTVSNKELDSALAYAPRVRNTLNTSQGFRADFNRDGFDETVNFAAGKFFDNPINNFKSLLPGYTTRVERDSLVDCFFDPDLGFVCYAYKYFWAVTIVWNADTFDEWMFPNPTVNGIVPDITTDALFKQTFGFYPEDFSKEIRIDILSELPN